jgi:hypothetical protein
MGYLRERPIYQTAVDIVPVSGEGWKSVMAGAVVCDAVVCDEE